MRILRVARFAARFPDFRIADETAALLREMVARGEVDALVPERVWQEFAKGFAEARPGRMLAVLAECGALERVLPEWRAIDEVRALAALAIAADRQLALAERFAALFAGADPAAVESACARLKCPGDCRDLAVLAARFSRSLENAARLDAAALVDLLGRCDAYRRPDRFAALLEAVDCDAMAQGREQHYLVAQRLVRALKAAQGIDAGRVAAADPANVAEAIRQARVAAVASALEN